MHRFINGKYHSAFNAITDILCINYCYRPTAGNHYDCNCTALNNRYSCPLNLGLRGHIVLHWSGKSDSKDHLPQGKLL